MKPPRFSYLRADGTEHACRLLADHGEDASILAGGQSLMPTLNMRLSRPKLLVDINRCSELEGISFDGKTVRIGALTRHVDVMNSEIVKQHLPLIAEAIKPGHRSGKYRGVTATLRWRGLPPLRIWWEAD